MTKMINPAPGGWFVRGWIPGDHRGTDLGWYNADVDGSRRIVAVAAGTVISESVGGGYNDGWGNQYVIDHGHGIFTTYNHLATGTMQLDVGQRVEAGTYVGQMGATGKTNGEVHLHFEVRVGGPGADNRVDPGPWLDGSKEIPGDEQLLDYQRRVTGDGVYERTGPGTQYARTGADREFAAGDVLDFKAWTRGEAITLNGVTSDVWYQGRYAGMWFSAACFTSQSTAGLAEVTFVPPTTPSGPVDPEWKNRTPDSALATWIGSPNFNYRTPRAAGAKPTHVTVHWMDGTLAGTDAHFQTGDGEGSASTYGVGQTEIHQYVREGDYQQADGNTFSNRWGLSIEHEASTKAPATAAVQALSARLLADIARRNGWDVYVLGDAKMSEDEVSAWAKANPTKGLLFWHSKWVATACPGTLPYAAIMAAANTLLAPTTPDPEPSNPDDKPVTVGWLKQLFEAIVAAVRAFFGSQK